MITNALNNPKLPVGYYEDDKQDVVVREHTRKLPLRKKIKSHEVEYKRLKRKFADDVVEDWVESGGESLAFERGKGGGPYEKTVLHNPDNSNTWTLLAASITLIGLSILSRIMKRV